MIAEQSKVFPKTKKNSIGAVIIKDFRLNKYIYIMLLPVVAYYIIFCYAPMYGAIIAFKDFSPIKGILGSPWVGFRNFLDFFDSYYFFRILRNTLQIGILSLLFGFPAPIILALLLNEVKNKAFKSTIQTATYLPHFISIVVVCGMIVDFTAKDGVITNLVTLLGGKNQNLLSVPSLFQDIYVSTDIWQQLGWGSIIFLAALSGVDEQLYESARLDGAGRFKQMLHVTLPGLMPTIVIMLILRMGQLVNIGFEKVILIYSPITYETGDIISSFVYRKGLLEFNFSYSTAVGLFNSVINCALLIVANQISRKVNDTSLW
jgi:putative aldouronate transport system permease protein